MKEARDVHAGEQQASCVQLLHVTAADAAARYPALARRYVGSEHETIVAPLALVAGESALVSA